MYVHLYSCLSELFFEWETFHTSVVEKIKTHFIFSKFSPQILHCMGKFGKKYGGARQATGHNIIPHREDVICV
jgi:hypothetical protein